MVICLHVKLTRGQLSFGLFCFVVSLLGRRTSAEKISLEHVFLINDLCGQTQHTGVVG